MFNVRAAARFARLRSVPRQPNPQRKEQHQENSRSFLPFSFSPCSLIKGTRRVSGMLARRALLSRRYFNFRVLVGKRPLSFLLLTNHEHAATSVPLSFSTKLTVMSGPPDLS